MDDNEMNSIADEVFWQVMQARATFPGLYEFIMSEMDLDDASMDEAFIKMFGETPPEVNCEEDEDELLIY